jgi:hypothetical protein
MIHNLMRLFALKKIGFQRRTDWHWRSFLWQIPSEWEPQMKSSINRRNRRSLFDDLHVILNEMSHDFEPKSGMRFSSKSSPGRLHQPIQVYEQSQILLFTFVILSDWHSWFCDHTGHISYHSRRRTLDSWRGSRWFTAIGNTSTTTENSESKDDWWRWFAEKHFIWHVNWS